MNCSIEMPLVALPDNCQIILVDGCLRPARNDRGELIHWSAEGVRNFWRWFGDSKVVDAAGRPVVTYHGTEAEFDVFDSDMVFSMGHHFGSEAQANERSDGAAMPVYLRIVSPLLSSDAGWSDPDDIVQCWRRAKVLSNSEARELKQLLGDWQDAPSAFRVIQDFIRDKFGADGITYLNEFEGCDEDSYVAFRPEQIKSAAGDNWAFDAGNPSISDAGCALIAMSSPSINPAIRLRG